VRSAGGSGVAAGPLVRHDMAFLDLPPLILDLFVVPPDTALTAT